MYCSCPVITMSSWEPTVLLYFSSPPEYVVNGSGGYVEVDLDACLPVVVDVTVVPPSHGGVFAKVATL